MKGRVQRFSLMFVSLVLIAAFALTAGCAGEQEPPGKALVNEKCSQCHDLTRIDEVPPNADWDQIIQMMIDVYRAPITQDEKVIMAEYLETL